MLPDKGRPPSLLQGTDQTVSQLRCSSDKGSCSGLSAEASSCLCRQAVTRGATQGQRHGAAGSPGSHKARRVRTQAHASPAPRGRLSVLSRAPFCAGRSGAAHQADSSACAPARSTEKGCASSAALCCWLSPQLGSPFSSCGYRPSPQRAGPPGGLSGSQRLSVQHPPGSWQRGCSLSEAAPELHQPQRACSPGRALGCSPTGCIFWTWHLVSPVRYEHIPSAATPAPGASRSKTPLQPPSCSSSAGAGTSPWHQDTSQLIWHVNERAPTAC